MTFDVQLVGHICVDLAPEMQDAQTTPGVLYEVGTMQISVGGAVGNCWRAVRRLGRRPAAAALVGDDPLGAMARQLLADEDADAVHLQVTSSSFTSYSVVVQPSGVDRTFWHHTGANDEFVGDCALVDAPILHCGYPTLAPALTRDGGQPSVDLFMRAREQGMATSLDLAYCADNSVLKGYDWDGYFRTVLPHTDVFCPSWDDVLSARNQPASYERELIERAAAEFLDWGAAVALVTVGEHGSYIATGARERVAHLAKALGSDAETWSDSAGWIAAAPISNFVSSNGAGDTFKAAFLMSALSGMGPIEAAESAAGIVARHIAGLPLLDE